MANAKITDLVAIAGADTASDDEFPIVDVSAGSSGTKKITRAELAAALSASGFPYVGLTGDEDVSGVKSFLDQLITGVNTNGLADQLVAVSVGPDLMGLETENIRGFFKIRTLGGTVGAGNETFQLGAYAPDFFSSGSKSETIVNGPTAGYNFCFGAGGENTDARTTYVNELGQLFFGDLSRPSITPTADTAIIVGKELTQQSLIEFFQVDPATEQALVVFNNSLDARAARISFLEDTAVISPGTRVSGLNLGVDEDAEVGIYSLGQIMTKVGSYGTLFTDGSGADSMLVNIAGKLTFYKSAIFQTTVGSSGSADVLPTRPREYLQVTTPSGNGLIPVYNEI